MTITDASSLPVKEAGGWTTETALALKTYIGTATSGAYGVAPFVSMSSLTIGSSVELLRTTGYNSVGDGGGAAYAKVASEPTGAAAPGSFQTVDGAWWLYQRDARGVNCLAFGAVADGVVGANFAAGFTGTDNSAAIQAAIDFGGYYANSPIYLPAGRYKCNTWPQLGYGAGTSTFRTIQFEGDYSGYAGQNGTLGTTILANNTQGGINVQGARNSRVKGIAFIGLNWWYLSSNGFGSTNPTYDDLIEANWIDPNLTSLNANVNGQHTPYSGCVIDAYLGGAPSPSYPIYTYPSWTGIGSQYSKSASSNVIFEDCYFAGFVKAQAIHPNGSGNGDFVKFIKCQTTYNVVVLSAGDAQGRLVEHDCCQNSVYWAGIENGAIGQQSGCLQFITTNSGWDQGVYLLNVSSSTYAGDIVFKGCYGELMWSLGTWGSGAGYASPCAFEQCRFSISGQSLTRGVPQYFFSNYSSAQMVAFRDSSFDSQYSLLPLGGIAYMYSFENVAIRANNATAWPSAYQWTAWMATQGIVFNTSAAPYRPDKFKVTLDPQYDVGTGSTNIATQTGEVSQASRHYLSCMWNNFLTDAAGSGVAVANPRRVSSGFSPYYGSHAVSLTGLVLSIDISAYWTDAAQQTMAGAVPGGLIYETSENGNGYWFLIYSNISGVILAELQNGFRQWPGSTTLSAAITTAAQTSISVTANSSFAQFSYQGGMVVQIDNEQMLVTAGYTTDNWTVTRAYNQSAAFTGAVSATTLTVTDCVGPIVHGAVLSGASISGSPTISFMPGSGTGGNGTYVLSVSQSTISAESMTSTTAATHSSSAAVTGATILLGSNSYAPEADSFFFHNTAVYVGANPYFGDLTSGNATITNVGQADGTVGGLATDVNANDYLYINNASFYPVTTENALVASVNSSSGPYSITLAGNARYSQTRVGPLLFVRQPPANQANP